MAAVIDRVVAVFEAVKGIAAVAVGAGVLSLLHRNVADVAGQLAKHLHLNPAKNHPQVFVDLASRIQDTHLRVIAVGAACYAALRLVMAWGLWFERSWAEWLTAASAGIYVPFEVYELCRGVTGLKLATLLGNLLIIAVMIFVIRRRKAAQ